MAPFHRILVLCFFVFLVQGEDEGNIPTVKIESEACAIEQPQNIKTSYGFLLSPGFDSFHFMPPKLKCAWLLIAPEDKIIHFHFMQLNLADCIEAILEVYDGDSEYSPLLSAFCGRNGRTSNRYKSKTNKLFFKLRTGQNPFSTGYNIYFEHIKNTACKLDESRCRNDLNCFSINQQCDGVDNCGDGTDEEYCGNLTSNHNAICGSPEIEPYLSHDRIVGGIAVRPNSWPWQASLRAIHQEPLGHQCGGTLINSQWIVTAAHCFREIRDSRYWMIALGKHRKVLRDETEQSRYIDSIYIHNDYKGLDEQKPNMTWLERKENDIALVKLNAPITINRYVQPACLPTFGFKIEPGTEVFTIGWGYTYGTGNDFVLKQAAIPIVLRSLCRIFYPYYEIGDKMLCAGFEQGGHDACSGDSGGPLIQRGVNGTWQLIGVISTGGVCAAPKEPGIYTEVSKYIDWIQETIDEHSNPNDF